MIESSICEKEITGLEPGPEPVPEPGPEPVPEPIKSLIKINLKYFIIPKGKVFDIAKLLSDLQRKFENIEITIKIKAEEGAV